jgi:hypothetical protein
MRTYAPSVVFFEDVEALLAPPFEGLNRSTDPADAVPVDIRTHSSLGVQNTAFSHGRWARALARARYANGNSNP